MEKVLNAEEFKNLIENTSKPVIVDFFASWCGPCKMLAPVLESVKKNFEDEVELIKIDIDKCSELASEYDIMSVPTIMFFSDGELVQRESGFMPQEKIEELIKSNFCISSAK